MPNIINYQGSLDALVWHKERKGLTSDTEVIVPVSHEAVFIRDGKAVAGFAMGRYLLSECAVGPGRLFETVDERVNCSVYFVKKEGGYNIKWQSFEPLRFVDPLLRIPVEIEAGGAFAIKIIDAQQFLTRLLTVTKKVNLEEVKSFFRDKMAIYIKDGLLAVMSENGVSSVELNAKLMAVSKNLELRMRYVFEPFGVSVEGMLLKKAQLVGASGLACDTSCPEKGAQPCEAGQCGAGGCGKGEKGNCPKCKAILPPGSNFCFKCGEKIG